MSTSDAIPPRETKPPEAVPGYRLLERIGRGGYGEVWKAIAPGGVSKAVKLVYGDDSARLTTELRALNRVKDVRHPFLLSIERIEQNGDLLAIVTELGDQNLQQYYESLRAKGFPGIPQDELLRMLRDAADVLDFIYQEYALQHLDIKPANLLLFGRRLKVADFGLVKNIYERTSSQVHGLTPTYAAPEIFEGQPTRSTDQYSLAILYQEMLTGVLPFNGATPARLATQHLREAPDLSPLPPAQRPVIARALSKNAQQRFSSCLELVEELIKASQRTVAETAQVRRDGQATRPVQSQATPPSAPISRLSLPTSQTQAAAAGDTGHSSSAEHPPAACPTIVIGVGGAAGKALQRLRLRIGDRWGSISRLPAFKMIFVDVDSDSLNEANQNQQTWSELETIPTPLRSSAEYRDQGDIHRRWLSRRWLYNVPRDLRTEGLRPLGRLALLTNAARITHSLKSAIEAVSMACPEVTPRVLLVSSISGGTGSGMLLDLAYACRHALHVAGFSNADVDGVLLYSSPLGTGRDKAILNAIATLSELDHYSRPGSFYPGEPLLKVPSFHGNNQTFATTDFMHLGEGLDAAGWQRAIDNVAEYVYSRIFTNLDRAFLGVEHAVVGKVPKMSLVDVQQIGGYAGRFVDDLTRQLCVDTIDGWCGVETQSDTASRNASAATLLLNAIEANQTLKNQKIAAESEQQTLACGVDPEQLLKQARNMLEQELTVTQREFLKAQLSEVFKAVSPDAADHEIARLAIALQDQAIGLDFGERPHDSPHNTLFALLYARLASQSMPIATRFVSWVLHLIDQPHCGIDGAIHAAETGRSCIRDLINILAKEAAERTSQQTSSRIRLSSPPKSDEGSRAQRGWLMRRHHSRDVLAESLIEHGLSSFEELLGVLVQWQLRAVEAHVSTVIDQLLTQRHELKHLSRKIAAESTAAAHGTSDASGYEELLRRWLVDHRQRLAQQLRTHMERTVLTGPKQLQNLLQQSCAYEDVLGVPLRHYARQVVLHSIDQMLSTILRRHAQGLDNRELDLDRPIVDLLRRDWTLNDGESERAVLLVPSQTGETTFQSRSVPELPRIPIIAAQTNNIAVCRKRCCAAIPRVIRSIARGQLELLQVAANLRTRIDVDWLESELSDEPFEFELRVDAPGEISQTISL